MRNFIVKYRLFFLCVVSLALLACAPQQPTMFGVPQDQWQTLSPEQQQAAIDSSNTQQNQQERDRPMNEAVSGAIGAALGSVHSHKTLDHSDSQSSSCTQTNGAEHCESHEEHSSTSIGIN